VGTPEQAGTDRLHSLLSALKLPADSLSANLISFCRYFSLPLESASLGVLRREILVQKKREAAALGSAAAAGKGLVLESRALEEYAGAIDPAQWQEEQDAGQNGQYTPGENSERDRAKKEDTAPKLKAGDIEETVTKTLKNRPPLDFINRIPGKNGRRWVVVPFSFSGDGMDIKASFRILLADPSDETSRLERFAADIAVFREKELSRRWFLLLEGTSGRVSAELPGAGFTPLRAEFSVFPPLPEEVSQGVPGKAAADVSGGKSLAREIAKTFALPVDKIQAGGGNFADSRNDLLRTVDEEV
jgi:hypothetical protein